MVWLKGMLTRAAVGEVVHVSLWVLQPGMPVNHLLVTLAVFVVATLAGVGTTTGVDPGA